MALVDDGPTVAASRGGPLMVEHIVTEKEWPDTPASRRRLIDSLVYRVAADHQIDAIMVARGRSTADLEELIEEALNARRLIIN